MFCGKYGWRQFPGRVRWARRPRGRRECESGWTRPSTGTPAKADLGYSQQQNRRLVVRGENSSCCQGDSCITSPRHVAKEGSSRIWICQASCNHCALPPQVEGSEASMSCCRHSSSTRKNPSRLRRISWPSPLFRGWTADACQMLAIRSSESPTATPKEYGAGKPSCQHRW